MPVTPANIVTSPYGDVQVEEQSLWNFYEKQFKKHGNKTALVSMPDFFFLLEVYDKIQNVEYTITYE